MVLAWLAIPFLADPGHADSNGDWRLLFDPAPRRGHGTFYDPVDDALLVFGGGGTDYVNRMDLWRVPLTGPAVWSALPVSAPHTHPFNRSGCSSIYDPVRHRIIVYGGLISDSPTEVAPPYTYTTQVWALSLGASRSWTQLLPAGPAPPGRSDHSAIYDPVRDRMIVVGGSVSGTASEHQDAWALSLGATPTWTRLADPPDRSSGSPGVYDSARDRMVMFYAADLWALSLASGVWSVLPRPASRPGVRSNATLLYDPGSDGVVLFGGFVPYQGLDETWVHSFATGLWSQVTGGTPGPRYYLTSAYDPVRERMVLTGGGSDGDVWALPLDPLGTWFRLYDDPTLPTAPAPSARDAMLDSDGQRMVVWKTSGAGHPQEFWGLALQGTPEWSQLTVTGTAPQFNYPLDVLDTRRNRMIVFGYARDAFALPLSGAMAWQRIVPATPPPASHFWGLWTAPTGIYDPVRDRLLVFGGMFPNCRMEGCNPIYYRELWQLNFDGTPTWTQLHPAGPTPQDEGWAIYDPVRDRMLMFAGAGNTWELALSGTPTWTRLPDMTVLPGRVVYDSLRDRLVAYGGERPKTWEQSPPGSGVWTELADRDRPKARFSGVTIYDPARDRMVVHGPDGSNLTWVLDWGDGITATQVNAEPAKVTSSSAVLSWNILEPPTSVTVMRTRDGNEWMAVARLTPAAGRMEYEDRDVLPGRRYGYALVWAGTEGLRAGEVWVEIPSGPRLALSVASSPGNREVEAFFSLPSNAPARLDLFDLLGRRIARWDVGDLGAGEHRRALDVRIRSGLFLLRLAQGGESKTARVLRIR